MGSAYSAPRCGRPLDWLGSGAFGNLLHRLRGLARSRERAPNVWHSDEVTEWVSNTITVRIDRQQAGGDHDPYRGGIRIHTREQDAPSEAIKGRRFCVPRNSEHRGLRGGFETVGLACAPVYLVQVVEISGAV
jgi:hypothetical protein